MLPPDRTGRPAVWRRLVGASVVGAILLVACAGAGGRGGDEEGTGTPRPGGGGSGRPADLTKLTEADLTKVLSPDSIPAIDDPKFTPPKDAGDWLTDREPVIALEIEGDARAYPLQIMTWHEIVNDEVGRRPVAVTYCPLCNSSVVFIRVLDGKVFDFGTSGSLYNSDLVMFDRQTESLWLQFEGLAIEGELEGTRLEFIPAQVLSFEQWRAEHPDGKVLSRDTGFNRPYGSNPYEFYDTNENPFLFRGEADSRMNAIAKVVGVELGGEAVAYPYSALSEQGEAGVVQDTVGGREVVVLWKAGAASALDNPDIAEGRDVGSAGVFVPEAGGRPLTFEVRGGDIWDRETGSGWSVAGKATSGPLEGEELEPVAFLDTFWFAWSSFNRDTEIFGR